MNDRIDVENLCIWGAGLVGYSLARAFAGIGRRCLLIDVAPDVVDRINRGKVPFAYDPPFVTHPDERVSRLLRATTDAEEGIRPEYPVHLLAIPTERNGAICSDALRQVCTQIASARAAARPLYLILESTISPAWIDEIVHATFQAAGWRHNADYHVGCSPRRDVFGDTSYSMQSLSKVYGADSAEGAELMRVLYGPVCKTLHRALDARHAALTKLVENLFRHQAILLANRLTAALPGVDMAEVLRLAATKWNMNHYHPSLGIGGYCVPLARDYLAPGLDPEWCEFLGDPAEEARLTDLFLDSLFCDVGRGRVGLLGFSYAPGLRIHVNAPALRVIRYLQKRNVEVAVHDPYYTAAELEALAGVARFDFPSEVRDNDIVVVMTAHQEYMRISDRELAAHLPARAWIIDNCGAWRERSIFKDFRYTQIGGANFRADPSEPQPDALRQSVLREFIAGDEHLNRKYLGRLEQSGELPAFHAHVDRILEIDRDYLHVHFDGLRMNIPRLAERVRSLRTSPVASLTDAQIDTICALAVYGMAWVRLEFVDMNVTMRGAKRYLSDTIDVYNRHLLAQGEAPFEASPSAPWWEVASLIPGLRERIDRHYGRLSLINGENWFRREVLLAHRELMPRRMPDALVAELESVSGVRDRLDPDSPMDGLRCITSALLEQNRSPLCVVTTLMHAAARDPRIQADHSTLLCPCGTKFERPWEMCPDDFLAYVVFRPGFEPPAAQGVQNPRLIQKAMLAHHAAKKTKLARRYKARYGPNSVARLADNLGDLGIYYNEDKHHKGHQIAGIVTAMRYLMTVNVQRPEGEVRIEGLTDFRVTRTGQAERLRFRLEEFPAFYDYGGWIRTVLESSYARGFQFPRMLEEWK
jgi:nucleotide sugar dehydrogenase